MQLAGKLDWKGLINMYIASSYSGKVYFSSLMFFFHDFVKLSVKLHKSVTVNLSNAKMEGPYVLYKQVLLYVKI